MVFSFEMLIEDCFIVLTSMKGDKDIELVNETSEKLTLHTDYHRLKRIILNLLTNALKYTKAGTIAVRAQAKAGVVEIEVKDTGVGIEKDALNKLFKEFNSNVENKSEATQSVYNKDGIGLGLVTSLNLVEKLGPARRIKVESEKGKGSRFSFAIYKNFSFKLASSARVKEKSKAAKSSKKGFTSVFDRINDNDDSATSKPRSLVDLEPRHILKLPTAETTSKLTGLPKEASAQYISSSGTGSSGKRKLHILIFEAIQEIIEVRVLLDEYLARFKSEFSLQFEYDSQVDSALARLAHLEESQGVVMDLVYVGVKSGQTPEEMIQAAALAKGVADLYRSRKRHLPSIFLVNDSGLTLARLKQIWEPVAGFNAADLFYDVFEGMPDEMVFCKATAKWHKFTLRPATK